MNHHAFIVRAAGAALSGLAILTGCVAGRVHLLPFARSDLAEGEPPVPAVDIHEAFWWTEDDGSLWVVLDHGGLPRSPGLQATWAMSIRLPGPPAGRERLYQLGQEAVRMVHAGGLDRRRASSFAGCVVLTAVDGERLHGRFHINLRQQVFSVLTGWTPAPPMSSLLIAAGEFVAVRDESRGRTRRDFVLRQGFRKEDESCESAPASAASLTVE